MKRSRTLLVSVLRKFDAALGEEEPFVDDIDPETGEPK
mgnify:FL=1